MESQYRILGSVPLKEVTNPLGGVALDRKIVRLSRRRTPDGVKDFGLHTTVVGRAVNPKCRKVQTIVGEGVREGDPNSEGTAYVSEIKAAIDARFNACWELFEEV